MDDNWEILAILREIKDGNSTISAGLFMIFVLVVVIFAVIVSGSATVCPT